MKPGPRKGHMHTRGASSTSTRRRDAKIRELAAEGVGPLSIAVRLGCSRVIVNRTLGLPANDGADIATEWA